MIEYLKSVKEGCIYRPKTPEGFKEAVLGPEREHWWVSMKGKEGEWTTLSELGTFRIIKSVPGPGDDRVVRSMWVYKIQFKEPPHQNEVKRYKSRLVAVGKPLREGSTYVPEEVYATCLRLDTLRLLVILGIQDPDCGMWHWDIKNAFVSADLKRPTRVIPPPGVDIGKGNILLAVKAIYGLPESMRLFCDKLKRHLEEFGLCFSRYGNVFTFTEGKEYIRIAVQVDDMIV